MDRDAKTRARIEQHWEASERGDSETEHAIYTEDAILDYPQSNARDPVLRRPLPRACLARRPSRGDIWRAGGSVTMLIQRMSDLRL